MIDEYKEIHSTVPFWMKRQSKWVVTTGETLKGKKHTMVTTRQAFKDGGNEKMKILSSNHVSVEKDEEEKKNLSKKMLKNLSYHLRREINQQIARKRVLIKTE